MSKKSSQLEDQQARQLALLSKLLQNAGLKPEDHIDASKLARAVPTKPRPHGVYSDPDEHCPKCGTHGEGLHRIEYDPDRDLLICACSRCGFAWEELPFEQDAV